MSTILYRSIIYGPVHSRRLGISLGVNLLPTDGKICSFDCIYCECGFNKDRRTRTPMPTREAVKTALHDKLIEMKKDGLIPDVITFAGNGEPTLHPDFAAIIDDTIATRDKFCPSAKIAVLSNSTQLARDDVFKALERVDENIMKFDSVLDSRIRQVDQPNIPSFEFSWLLEHLCRFNGRLIIQTMFLRGKYKGEDVDNTTEAEVSGWLEALKKINPRKVMIYTIDRETPDQELQKVTVPELEVIAERARQLGFEVSVSG